MRKRAFAEFLQQKLDKRGDPSRFAQNIGVSTSTVSGWMSGRMIPNFSNCLPISTYFDIRVEEVFELIDRPDFIDRLIEGSNAFRIIEHRETIVVVDPEHLKAHKELENILGRAKAIKHELAQMGRHPTETETKIIKHAEWISGNIEVFEERGSGKASPPGPPKPPAKSLDQPKRDPDSEPITKSKSDHEAQWIYERRSGTDRRRGHPTNGG